MDGENILVRSLSSVSITDDFGNSWQYHSQSDRHSKIACWALLFDLLQHCALLQQHAAAGKIAFGMNHRMVSARTNEAKNLDLVVCVPRSEPGPSQPIQSFAELANSYRIDLDKDDTARLKELPPLSQRPVGDVLIAVEAKACMTKHVGSIRRLRGEFADTLEAIHGTSQSAIAVAHGVVNASTTFISPPSNRRPDVFPIGAHTRVSNHSQPRAAHRIQESIGALPFRQTPNEYGYDVVGITTIDLRNDQSRVSIAEPPLALSMDHARSYHSMVMRIGSLYRARFAYL